MAVDVAMDMNSAVAMAIAVDAWTDDEEAFAMRSRGHGRDHGSCRQFSSQ